MGQWPRVGGFHSKEGETINLLKLRVIFLALKTFVYPLRNKEVLVYMDNIMTRAYVNQHGGTCSSSL